MVDRGPDRAMSGFPEPQPLDPFLEPELYDGVLPRRVLAFLVDMLILTAPVIFATILIFLFGILTLGVGWLLYWLLTPAVVIWALVYYGMTLGGPKSATIGMQMVGLEMRSTAGAKAYGLLGAVHAVLFWVSTSALTPFVLLVCFFNHRRRLLHDILLGTVVINAEPASRRGEIAQPR